MGRGFRPPFDLVCAVLAVLALAPSALLGIPGVESALVLGIVLPPVIAGRIAYRVASASGAGVYREALPLLGRAFSSGLGTVLVASALLLLNAYRLRPCDPLSGLAFLAVGPLAGAGLASLVGVLVGGLGMRPRRAAFVAALVPLSALAAGLAEFAFTPAIYVYGLFGGFFPGSIYDENVGIPSSFLGFRGLSLALAAGLALGIEAGWDGTRFSFRTLLSARRRLGFAVLLLAGCAWGTLDGASLGHRSTVARIDEALGGEAWSRRCHLHVPRELPVAERRLLADDCDFHVGALESFLGVHRAKRVQVFVYRSPDEKRVLMGAADTDIAKPWLGQVHIEREAWPHRVLRHELAHVLAAELTNVPFRVAAIYGIVPNPGIIEGTAVAAAGDHREGLTADQWSRAMLELGLLPKAEDVLTLEFLRTPANRAYSAAGSFLRHVHERRGPRAIRNLYDQGQWEALGELHALERSWHAHLRTVRLTPEERALAVLRFERKSVFSAVCPHLVARLKDRLGEDLAAGDSRSALETCSEILSVDANDRITQATRASALARLGRLGDAEREVAAMGRDPQVPSALLATARAAIADARWLRGDATGAHAAYARLLSEPMPDDAARMLEVKKLALEDDATTRELVRSFFLHRDGRPASTAVAVHLGHRLAEHREDGLGPYLVGRQLFHEGEHALAARELERALGRGLPTARLQREAMRLAGLAHEAVGEWERADALFERLLGAPFVGNEAELQRARIGFLRGR